MGEKGERRQGRKTKKYEGEAGGGKEGRMEEREGERLKGEKETLDALDVISQHGQTDFKGRVRMNNLTFNSTYIHTIVPGSDFHPCWHTIWNPHLYLYVPPNIHLCPWKEGGITRGVPQCKTYKSFTKV